MKPNVFLYGLVMLLTQACWERAEVPLPAVEPKMVVAAFLSPEDTFRVYLSKSNSIQDKLPDNPDYILNASVFLSDGQDTVQLIGDPMYPESYIMPSPALSISPGKTYYFWAKATGFPSVSAQCQVPSYKLPAQGTVTSITKFKNANSDTVVNIGHTWVDLAGQKNYYRINNWIIDSNRVLGTFNDFQLSMGASELVSDSEQDGEKLEMRIDRFGGSNIEFGVDRYLVAYILTVDENYYRYHLSTLNFSGDTPFGFQENIYTNVSGGLGIFAAYRKETKRIRFP